MLTAALFTIARTQEQSICPSREEWVKKMWKAVTMEYHTAKKKE